MNFWHSQDFNILQQKAKKIYCAKDPDYNQLKHKNVCGYPKRCEKNSFQWR